MSSYIGVVKRYVFPYKKNIGFSIFFNVLVAILNLLAFSMIMPILKILFGMTAKATSYIPLDSISWKGIKSLVSMGEALINNFTYYIESLIEQYGASKTLIFLCIYLILMTFLKVLSAYLAKWTLIPVRTGVVRDLRNKLNDKITILPMSFMNEEHKGDILARISGDVGDVEWTIVETLEVLIKDPILLIIYLGTLFAISWELTLFVFLVLPPAGYLMGLIGKKLRRQSLEGQNMWGNLMSQVEETLGGLRIIKAFRAEERIRSRFRTSNEEYRKLISMVYKRQDLAHPVSEFLGTIAIAIILWYGGSLILNGESSILAPTFIYYLIIFYSIIQPAKELSRASYAVQKGMASIDRIEKILDIENPIVSPPHPRPISFEKEISFNNVSFSYSKEKLVLKQINLKIEKGKTIAFVGSSGSGKSTLVDLLPRFWDVSEGSITIDGVDIREFKLSELRGLIGNVNQDPILFNETIYNNIAFSMEKVNKEEVDYAAKIANAYDFISRLPEGYETNIGDRGCRLSGGERQRVSIARAVLKNPPILILDEATSSLDNESERLVQNALDNLLKDRTTLVIAHRLSTIVNADLICVIDDGVIVEKGRHQDLLALDGYYTKLYRMQENRGE